jgi:hypothetical protein
MRSLWRRAVVSAVCTLALSAVAFAQGDPEADRTPSAEELALRGSRRAEATGIISRMLKERAVRRVEDSVVAADASRIVRSLNEKQLDALLRGDNLVTVLTDQRLSVEVADGQIRTATAAALGDATSHLVFVPVPPCRIIDTRLGGGPLGANETRAFEVSGVDGFAAQGGNAGGCSIPQGAATPLAPSVVVNFIAVGPDGAGNLRAWEFGQPVPNASVINYAKVGGLNIANGVVVPIAGVSSAAQDLNIRADVSGTHVVADVTGYFTRFPIEQFQGALQTTVTPVSNTTLVDLSDGACHELNSCSITAPGNGTVLVEAWTQVVVSHTSGSLDRYVMQLETTGTVSCPEDDTVNTSDYEIPAALGTNADVDFTLSHARTFSISTGQARTYRLSGKMANGAGSLDKVENSHLICTFIPD